MDTIGEVSEAVNRYRYSRIRHIFKRDYDYIQEPKKSGYRSYHMVYQFHSDAKETYNKNMLIEIQFRTKLQHIWATAVEMMDIYTNSSLKSSQGDTDILRFFTLVSSVLAIQENMPVCPNTTNNVYDLVEELNYLNEKHQIASTLSTLNLAINHTKKKMTTKNIYYMVILDYSKMEVTIREFKSSELEIATKSYIEIERKPNINVVLTSATSFGTLREAYPNYFADIKEFIKIMVEITRKYRR